MRTQREVQERDLQILRGLAAGHTFARIGRDSTPPMSGDVAKHRARQMYVRLGAANQAHAVAIGYERGLLGGDCSGCTCLGRVAIHARAERRSAA